MGQWWFDGGSDGWSNSGSDVDTKNKVIATSS